MKGVGEEDVIDKFQYNNLDVHRICYDEFANCLLPDHEGFGAVEHLRVDV